MYKRMNILLSVAFAGLFMSVCAVQYLLYSGEMVSVSNFDDGKKISAVGSSVYSAVGEIYIKSGEGVKILVNGNEYSAEENVDGAKKYTLNDGDIIHADLRECGYEGVIYIYGVSENVTYPTVGTKIPANGGVVRLFEVNINSQNF